MPVSPMCSQIMTPKVSNPASFVALLDEYGVESMVYDSHQDAQWIQFFRVNPAWVIDFEDQDAVLFVRGDWASSQ